MAAVQNLALATHRSFSLSSVGFLYEIRPTKPKVRTLLLPLWTVLSSQVVFLWCYFVREILCKWLPKRFFLTTTLCYGSYFIFFKPDMLQKIVKWKIAWKKWILPTLWSSRFFSSPFPPISSWTEWRHINLAWLPIRFQYGGLRFRFFRDEFHQDIGNFRDWNFSEWKSLMFTCYKYRRRQNK